MEADFLIRVDEMVKCCIYAEPVLARMDWVLDCVDRLRSLKACPFEFVVSTGFGNCWIQCLADLDLMVFKVSGLDVII